MGAEAGQTLPALTALCVSLMDIIHGLSLPCCCSSESHMSLAAAWPPFHLQSQHCKVLICCRASLLCSVSQFSAAWVWRLAHPAIVNLDLNVPLLLHSAVRNYGRPAYVLAVFEGSPLSLYRYHIVDLQGLCLTAQLAVRSLDYANH